MSDGPDELESTPTLTANRNKKRQAADRPTTPERARAAPAPPKTPSKSRPLANAPVEPDHEYEEFPGRDEEMNDAGLPLLEEEEEVEEEVNWAEEIANGADFPEEEGVAGQMMVEFAKEVVSLRKKVTAQEQERVKLQAQVWQLAKEKKELVKNQTILDPSGKEKVRPSDKDLMEMFKKEMGKMADNLRKEFAKVNETVKTSTQEATKQNNNTTDSYAARLAAPPKRQKEIVVQRNRKDFDKTKVVEMRDAINKALAEKKIPDAVTITAIRFTEKGSAILTMKEGTLPEKFAELRQIALSAIQSVDLAVTAIQQNIKWRKALVHGIQFEHFGRGSPEGMQNLREEIEKHNAGVKLVADPKWLVNPAKFQTPAFAEKKGSSVVIAVLDKAVYDDIIKLGLKIRNQTREAASYDFARSTDQCAKCQGFGHHHNRCPSEKGKCKYCAGDHQSREHKCTTEGCGKTGVSCPHTVPLCVNCQGSHLARDPSCPVVKTARAKEDTPMQE